MGYSMLQQTINAVIYETVKIRLHCALLCCVSKHYFRSVLAWAEVCSTPLAKQTGTTKRITLISL